jgi:hypothetical protein
LLGKLPHQRAECNPTNYGLQFPSGTRPWIASIVPNSGPSTGGTTVVITGRNFTGATAVRFGANPAASFTVDSDTQITAVSPPA